MEVYTIEQGTNRRSSIIEHFESFIWTERYNQMGDFELLAEYTEANIARLIPGAYIGFDQSDRIMVVKKVLKQETDDGHRVLKVEGKSFESIFEDRVAKIQLTPSDWTLVGSAGSIARTMVYNVCIAGLVSSKDVIFGLTADVWPSGTSRTVAVKAGTLYERVKEICDLDNLGFKVTYQLMEGIPPNPPGLIFSSVIYNAPLNFIIYSGTDRTGIGGVAFSEENDSLFSVSEFISEEGYKNVAYVYSNTQSVIVDESNPPTLHPGFLHKPMLVDATDVTTTGSSGLEILRQRGREALTSRRRIALVDGKINPDSIFKYKTHYFLGDLVTVNSNGAQTTSRVTEYIWTYDSDGLNGYPTLTAQI